MFFKVFRLHFIAITYVFLWKFEVWVQNQNLEKKFFFFSKASILTKIQIFISHSLFGIMQDCKFFWRKNKYTIGFLLAEFKIRPKKSAKFLKSYQIDFCASKIIKKIPKWSFQKMAGNGRKWTISSKIVRNMFFEVFRLHFIASTYSYHVYVILCKFEVWVKTENFEKKNFLLKILNFD